MVDDITNWSSSKRDALPPRPIMILATKALEKQ